MQLDELEVIVSFKEFKEYHCNVNGSTAHPPSYDRRAEAPAQSTQHIANFTSALVNAIDKG